MLLVFATCFCIVHNMKRCKEKQLGCLSLKNMYVSPDVSRVKQNIKFSSDTEKMLPELKIVCQYCMCCSCFVSPEYKNTCLGKITMHKYTSSDATPEWFTTVSHSVIL